jgi:rod shape-determining protein MreB
MLDIFFGLFSHDLGIDLGTANTLVLVKGRGIVMREPSVVALHKKSKTLLAVGAEAREMLGKTPQNILAIRPLRDGVISDFDSAQKLIGYVINKTHQSVAFLPKIPRPRVVVGVPSGITEVERKAVIDAVLAGGARKVYLVEQPMAAAIGAGLPVEKAQGNLIVDSGGGTTEVAVVSLSGIVGSKSLRVAGDKLDNAIVSFAKDRFNLLLGERTAEEIKIAVGQVGELGPNERTAIMRGRDLESGLPKSFEVGGSDLRETLERVVENIAKAIKETVEETPPELVSDIIKNGIFMVGGTSQLAGLSDYIQKYVGISCRVCKDPITAVARGTGILLEDEKLLRRVAIEIR